VIQRRLDDVQFAWEMERGQRDQSPQVSHQALVYLLRLRPTHSAVDDAMSDPTGRRNALCFEGRKDALGRVAM
jgi:hypothetical protein